MASGGASPGGYRCGAQPADRSPARHRWPPATRPARWAREPHRGQSPRESLPGRRVPGPRPRLAAIAWALRAGRARAGGWRPAGRTGRWLRPRRARGGGGYGHLAASGRGVGGGRVAREPVPKSELPRLAEEAGEGFGAEGAQVFLVLDQAAD